MNRIRALLLLLAALNLPLRAATYHLDAASGDDSLDGKAPERAWRTLTRVNEHTFGPGDQLLLKAGTRYKGQFAPRGSGAVAQPIVVGTYGKGDRPRIDAGGLALDAMLLRNVEFWEVRDLEITNEGTNRAPFRTGVRIVTDGFGTMHHIVLSNLFVHDVNGDLRKNREGCGIFFESRGANESRFDGLRVENCRLVRTDRNGICQRTTNRTRSTGVVIRGNLLEDIGGDGIKLWGSNGGLVEHNTLRGGRTRADDYAAGIWPFESDDTVIQFNEVSGMKGTKDGQGFDADYRCRRTLIQYNYSHDNEGGFILICTPGNSYNEDTVVRDNISQNDGINSARVFHFGGGAKNTRIHHNTIYIGPKQDLPLILCTDWSGGNADGTEFAHNIFHVEGRVTYDFGKSRNNKFTNNIFYGTHVGLPEGTVITNRSPLPQPGSGANGFSTLNGYLPATSSEPREQPGARLNTRKAGAHETGSTADLRAEFVKWNLPARRQGKRPTCSAFAVTGALEFALARQRGRGELLSVEYLNWASNDTVGRAQDGGFFSDLWKGYAAHGICAEQEMPYSRSFDPAQCPGSNVVAAAKTNLAAGLQLHWIKRWNVRTGLKEQEFLGIKQTLANGWPVCGGFRWPNHEKWSRGTLQMCATNEVYDGHSLLLVGYRDDAAQRGGGVFVFRNSSGGSDGQMPYAYAQTFMNDAAWIASESKK